MNDEKEAVEPLENDSPGMPDASEATGDPVSEPVDSAAESEPAGDAAGSAEEIAQQLEDARREARENWDKLLRLQAEMDNLRRRTEKELQNAHKFALDKFARELLPVVDSLELGIQAAGSDGADVSRLVEGGELTLQQFMSVLEKFEIRVLDPVGEPFNPEMHQAMAMEPSEEYDANTVIKVFQKGYQLNERLIRPAMVVVSQSAKPVKIDEQA